MRNWYNIQASAKDTSAVEISIFDEIGVFGVTARDFISDLRKFEAKTINLSINSPGGSVFDGLAIYNALRNSGATINVRVLGLAASIASVIAMAGDKIVMPENTFLMVHNPWTFAMGNAEELRDMADVLDKIGSSLVATYVARTGKTEDEIKTLLAAESYLTAQEAKDLGFADEVEAALKIAACFELDRLPESVRNAFQAAAKPIAPTQLPALTVDQITAAAAAAGLDEFAPHWAVNNKFSTVDDMQATFAEAREVKALCALVKRPADATAFIQAGEKLPVVRASLAALLAAKDEQTPVDTAIKTSNSPAQGAQPTAVKTADIWAARKLAIGGR